MLDTNERVENIILSRLDTIETKMDDGFKNLWSAQYENASQLQALREAMPSTCSLRHKELKEDILDLLDDKAARKEQSIKSWLRVVLGSTGLLGAWEIIKYIFHIKVG